MNTQSLKQNIEIIANVGVLLGIILLAYEVNQNNELLAAEARTTHMQIRRDAQLIVAANPHLSELTFKAVENEELKPYESYMLEATASSFITNWEWEFDQYQNGILDFIPVEGYIKQLNSFPFYRDAWNEWDHTYSPEFVAFMEENVISQLEE